MSSLILICAGDSMWDQERKISGWTDVPLSELGVNECKEAAYVLRGRKIDIAFTSVLKRGIHTCCIILDELDLNCVKIKKHWRLNPQHFGVMQGVSKSDAYKSENYEEILKSFDLKFPSISKSDENHPSNDFRYALVPHKFLPVSESLHDVQNRMLPYWFDKIAPCLLKGKNVLLVTHRNTVRALRHFLNDCEDNVSSLGIATAVPRVYEFNEKLEIVGKMDLADEEEVRNRINRISGF